MISMCSARFGKLRKALSVGVVASIAIAACSTTIPETDTISPRVELVVAGVGIGSQRMSNPPREVWTGEGGAQLFDLHPDSEYRFTLTVSDDGGVARATLVLPANMSVIETAPADVETDAGPLVRRLTVRGSRDDPRTALVISGRFRTPDLATMSPRGSLSFTLSVESSDFGGRDGSSPNQTAMRVEATVNAL